MADKRIETLGRRIARMRLQHGMTQERLAGIANVSAQAVSKWENDQSYPDIMLLPLLARTFGVTVDELLGIEDTAPQQATEPVPTRVEVAPLPVEDTIEAPMPVEEPQTEAVMLDEVGPIPAPEPEVTPESEPYVDTTTGEGSGVDIDAPASCIRLHVTRGGRDAVNFTIPLAAARLISNVASYMPDRLIEGVDFLSFAKSAQKAGKGTLVDVDDGNDRVVITLE